MQGILTRKDDPRNRRVEQEEFIARLQGLANIEVIQEAIRRRKNILIVGGAGAGKTTIANAVLEEIGILTPGDWVLVIEDTQELLLDSANSLSMLATTDFDQLKCLKIALRLKPDRIIVGEVRDGAAALPLLKAWNTGHPGRCFYDSCQQRRGGVGSPGRLGARSNGGTPTADYCSRCRCRDFGR